MAKKGTECMEVRNRQDKSAEVRVESHLPPGTLTQAIGLQ